MDWQPGSWDRTGSKPSASTKRWVTHARHDAMGPHREVARPSSGSRRGAGGISLGTEAGSKLITLDGSSGEGGGQILRTALTLSLLTGRPFRIVKIRANRDKPGLRPQHLKAVEAAATLGAAEVVGGSVGSRDLTFRPGKLEPRDLRVDIGTAGATALVLQTLHLPLALRSTGPVRLTLTGGTYNESAPSFPFLGNDLAGLHGRARPAGRPRDAQGRILSRRGRNARSLDRAGPAPALGSGESGSTGQDPGDGGDDAIPAVRHRPEDGRSGHRWLGGSRVFGRGGGLPDPQPGPGGVDPPGRRVHECPSGHICRTGQARQAG